MLKDGRTDDFTAEQVEEDKAAAAVTFISSDVEVVCQITRCESRWAADKTAATDQCWSPPRVWKSWSCRWSDEDKTGQLRGKCERQVKYWFSDSELLQVAGFSLFKPNRDETFILKQAHGHSEASVFKLKLINWKTTSEAENVKFVLNVEPNGLNALKTAAL